MSHKTVIENQSEQIKDSQYFYLRRMSKYSNRFTGTINKFTQPSFFWPNLFDDPYPNNYIFHVDNQTNKPLPDNLRGKPFHSLPDVYSKPEFMFVNNFTFEIFKKNEDYPWPTTLWQSKQNHFPVAITTLDLYPGQSWTMNIHKITTAHYCSIQFKFLTFHFTIAIARSSSSRADPWMRVAFKCFNQCDCPDCLTAGSGFWLTEVNSNIWRQGPSANNFPQFMFLTVKGGAGFVCKQYKYLENQEFDKSVKCSSDMTWTEKEFIFPNEAFIPLKQNGFAGRDFTGTWKLAKTQNG